MSVSDLFLAILSIDSYNRGYEPGVAVPGSEGDTIGTATIGKDAQQLLEAGVAEAAGFYAIAYDLPDGTTVISYRGTDDPGLELFSTDFPIIAGSYDEAQLALAVRFYQAVKADKPDADIILTGHSLGGGLAGYVT